jgi:hypothetical protein
MLKSTVPPWQSQPTHWSEPPGSAPLTSIFVFVVLAKRAGLTNPLPPVRRQLGHALIGSCMFVTFPFASQASACFLPCHARPKTDDKASNTETLRVLWFTA